jgi:hypothetical protein
MENDVSQCVAASPCSDCAQLVGTDKCKAERTPEQCIKEIADNGGRLFLFMLKDPFVEEGKEAFMYGYEKSDCPYPEDTDGEYGWCLGWKLADLEADANEAKGTDREAPARDLVSMIGCLTTGRYKNITREIP